jgi:uncharacterized integral membrane protein
MRRFLTIFVLLPIAIVIVALSVANRGDVTFSLDPFGGAVEGWSASAPLYVFLFLAVAFGIIIGGVATWLRQGRWRHAARVERAHAEQLRSEVAQLRRQADATVPGLPVPQGRDHP